MLVLETKGCSPKWGLREGWGWGPEPTCCPAAPCPLLQPVAMGTARLQRVAGRPWPGSTHTGSDDGQEPLGE